MQVKGVRLYAKDDIRLEEFELPEIKDDEILVKVMSDSIYDREIPQTVQNL